MNAKAQLKQALGGRMSLAALQTYYFGFAKTCPVCGAHIRRMLDQGNRFPILGELQIVGGMPKRSDECPVCRANSRTRLVYHYLREHGGFDPDLDVLHVAPERGLVLQFMKTNRGKYVCCDFAPEGYFDLVPIEKVDIRAIPYAERSFDLVLCNHVLEHVDNDRLAISEIYRVLKPGGRAILQVPWSMRLAKTREGLEVSTDQDRIDLYAQKDHVRIYTLADYVERLEQAGFEVDVGTGFDRDPEAAIRLDLDPIEPLVVCRRSP